MKSTPKKVLVVEDDTAIRGIVNAKVHDRAKLIGFRDRDIELLFFSFFLCQTVSDDQ